MVQYLNIKNKQFSSGVSVLFFDFMSGTYNQNYVQIVSSMHFENLFRIQDE